tara:strand:+ start:218 stop:433 length:216 start_codon:yes stop_codon:yes gene_type:complete
MTNNLREEIERICLQDITSINNIIATLSKKIQDSGTGHIHTAISVLQQLIEEKKAYNIQANALLKEEYQDD